MENKTITREEYAEAVKKMLSPDGDGIVAKAMRESSGGGAHDGAHRCYYLVGA